MRPPTRNVAPRRAVRRSDPRAAEQRLEARVAADAIERRVDPDEEQDGVPIGQGALEPEERPLAIAELAVEKRVRSRRDGDRRATLVQALEHPALEAACGFFGRGRGEGVGDWIAENA